MPETTGELWCAVHQPNLFPRLSTLAKLYSADVWVILDDVQFTRRDYQHRCRLADLHDPDGRQWLTLPVHLPQGRRTRIRDVRLTDPIHSRRRTARLLQQYYGRSSHWPALRDQLEKVLDTLDRTDLLAPTAETSTRILLDLLAWSGTVVHSSTIPTRPGRSERLADLSHAVGATTYLCGTGGARYLDLRPFAAHGINVCLSTPPADGDPTTWLGARHVTALRALMATGPDALRKNLQSSVGRRPYSDVGAPMTDRTPAIS
jgi:WbqC-like protein family